MYGGGLSTVECSGVKNKYPLPKILIPCLIN
jgi:hypothetical protein